MDAKTIGNAIAALRKKNGWTQAELASRLDVTDKAVSRWESGAGYPDVTILPRLAGAFNVTVDSILLGERKGITVAGNLIMDIVKSIDQYPACGRLAFTHDISYSVGGCAANTAIDLAKIDPTLPVSVSGRVGMDEHGRFILSTLQKNGINVSRIVFSEHMPTSFCDAMSVPSGERTFFNFRGANAEFSPADIDIRALSCDILHIGYLLLLDQFDAEDAQYGTAMARFLHDVQKAGIKTSIDMVSSSSPESVARTVIPALRYCDYVIINEIECCAIWNLEPRRADGTLHRENVLTAMKKTIDAGVRDRVIVHCKEVSFSRNAAGETIEIPSLRIPKEEIRGSVGAGDAFCAGCLYAIYHQYSDRQMLEFASAAAACNLFAVNSVDGMKNKNEILKIEQKYERLS